MCSLPVAVGTHELALGSLHQHPMLAPIQTFPDIEHFVSAHMTEVHGTGWEALSTIHARGVFQFV
jgi:hypothetical protein